MHKYAGWSFKKYANHLLLSLSAEQIQLMQRYFAYDTIVRTLTICTIIQFLNYRISRGLKSAILWHNSIHACPIRMYLLVYWLSCRSAELILSIDSKCPFYHPLYGFLILILCINMQGDPFRNIKIINFIFIFNCPASQLVLFLQFNTRISYYSI